MSTLTCAEAVADIHRIDYPNSRGRTIKVVGLGQGGAAIAESLGGRQLQNVQVVAIRQTETPVLIETLESLAQAEMLFVVACDGDDVSLAPQIKQAVRRSGLMVTAVLFQNTAQPPGRDFLAVLRAASDMLVIASDEDYVADMLIELGA